jgi:hypothetical protein
MFATPNIKGPPSSTQHSTSHICNIETQHPQHPKLMLATSKLFRSNFEKIK